MLYLGDSKRCSKCRKYKPLSEYHRGPCGPHGVQSRCKECVSARKYRDRADRFWKFYWAHVVRVGECLEWRGSYSRGVTPICWCPEGGAKNINVRRAVYRLSTGSLPDDMFAISTCRNLSCVSQRHIMKATAEDVEIRRVDSAATGRFSGARLRPDRLARGSRNGVAKLTEQDIPIIRARVAAGETRRAVAREKGVGPSIIGDIVRRKAWKHVP